MDFTEETATEAVVASFAGTGDPRLREGVDLDDGRTAPAKARVTQSTPAGSALEIVIHEGRNRQVRRMTAAVGHPTLRLVRCAIGKITLKGLEPGTWQALSEAEADELRRSVKLK